MRHVSFCRSNISHDLSIIYTRHQPDTKLVQCGLSARNTVFDEVSLVNAIFRPEKHALARLGENSMRRLEKDVITGDVLA